MVLRLGRAYFQHLAACSTFVGLYAGQERVLNSICMHLLSFRTRPKLGFAMANFECVTTLQPPAASSFGDGLNRAGNNN